MFTCSLSKTKNFRENKWGKKCNDNTSLYYKYIVLRSQRSHVNEQLQNPKIKECFVLLFEGVLIRNKF